jgi:hypothetical protein
MAIHGYRPAARRCGFVSVECENDRVYVLRLVHHDALAKALDEGQRWFTGSDNIGITVRIRLDQVVGVETYTPANVQAAISELDASGEEDRGVAFSGRGSDD